MADNQFIFVIFFSIKNSNNQCDLNLKKYDYENLICQEDKTLIRNIFIKEYDDIFLSGVFKSIYLKNNLAALIYFTSETSLNFRIFHLESTYSNVITKDINVNIFPGSQSLNDLIKINEERLVFITANYDTIYFIFIDLYNNYGNIKFRYYSYHSDIYIFDKELSGFNYNDYFIFTITSIDKEKGNTLSLLMIFGYANGTDGEIDISPYLFDSDSFDINLNLVSKLLESITIDNNIFEYEVVNEIKLINIPKELKFYKGEQELKNDDLLELNYIIKQNNELIKDSNYYNLKYQFIIKEPSYNIFYGTAHGILDSAGSLNYYYTPKFLYGRTNTLRFKLCHRFCGSCTIIGIDDNEQKCLSCLPDYQYDYFNLSRTNCVPAGYYYDIEINKLIKCDIENYIYKKDEVNNKTYCFPYKEVITTLIPTTEFIRPTTQLIKTTQFVEPTQLIETTLLIEPTQLIETTQLVESTQLIKTIPLMETTEKYIITEQFTEMDTIPFMRKCNYYDFLEGLCQYLNYTNYLILNDLIPNLIATYPNSNGSNLIIKGKDNITFQITTEKNEKDIKENILINIQRLSVLDLNGCDDKLRDKYLINPNDTLIILKVEKETNIVREKNIQYEIYHPITKEKLDISICDNIDINIPIKLNEDKNILYINIKENGYDLLNIQDSFYQDICSKYKTANGTDILLSDRKNYFYNNDLTCQDDCKYSSYSDKSQYLECECKIDNKNITLEKFKEFIADSFASVLKKTNYKFIKCYKLVFHINSITKNYGSIILIVLFFIQLIILIIYIIKGITSLKIDIIKITDNIRYANSNLKERKSSRISKQEEKKRRREKTGEINPPKKEIKPSGYDYIKSFFDKYAFNKTNFADDINKNNNYKINDNNENKSINDNDKVKINIINSENEKNNNIIKYENKNNNIIKYKYKNKNNEIYYDTKNTDNNKNNNLIHFKINNNRINKNNNKNDNNKINVKNNNNIKIPDNIKDIDYENKIVVENNNTIFKKNNNEINYNNEEIHDVINNISNERETTNIIKNMNNKNKINFHNKNSGNFDNNKIDNSNKNRNKIVKKNIKKRNIKNNSQKNMIKTKTKDNLHQLNTESYQDFGLNQLANSKDLSSLDDYELNNLIYEEALKLDKRTFIQIYCSMLRKKHIIMFIFCTSDDYNLSILKVSKLIFLLATNLAMSVLFFFDESMHKIYINSDGFNFIQQIPQIIYSSLVSAFLEYVVSFLILSEGEIHEIKKKKKKKKEENY